jgi:SAM-dependent methyltransferase
MTHPAPHFEGHPPSQPQPGSTWRAALSLIENESEVTRWLLQQRFLSRLMGGPLPPIQSLSCVHRALDVGCGVGAWAQEVARNYPSVQVVGLDRSAYCIERARAFAATLPNLTFLERDMYHLEGEPFAPGRFDLIHLRFLSGEVPCERFAELIASLGQLCRCGGLFVSCEAELPLTSSPACDFLASLLLCALVQAGRAFSPGFALRLGAVSWIRCWLHEAGFPVIHEHEFAVPISYGTQAHAFFAQQVRVFLLQVRPFLLQSGVIQEREREELARQAQQEVQSRQFEGIWPLHLLIGMKRLRGGRVPARPPMPSRSDGAWVYT